MMIGSKLEEHFYLSEKAKRPIGQEEQIFWAEENKVDPGIRTWTQAYKTFMN